MVDKPVDITIKDDVSVIISEKDLKKVIEETRYEIDYSSLKTGVTRWLL
jgi:hypothetical protein